MRPNLRLELRLLAVLCALLVCVGALGAALRPARQTPRCELRRSDRDGTTIEVWRRGQLAEEWQPRDGAIYRALDATLNDQTLDTR